MSLSELDFLVRRGCSRDRSAIGPCQNGSVRAEFGRHGPVEPVWGGDPQNRKGRQCMTTIGQSTRPRFRSRMSASPEASARSTGSSSRWCWRSARTFRRSTSPAGRAVRWRAGFPNRRASKSSAPAWRTSQHSWTSLRGPPPRSTGRRKSCTVPVGATGSTSPAAGRRPTPLSGSFSISARIRTKCTASTTRRPPPRCKAVGRCFRGRRA